MHDYYLQVGSLGLGTLLVANHRRRLRSLQSHLQGLSWRETWALGNKLTYWAFGFSWFWVIFADVYQQ